MARWTEPSELGRTPASGGGRRLKKGGRAGESPDLGRRRRDPSGGCVRVVTGDRNATGARESRKHRRGPPAKPPTDPRRDATPPRLALAAAIPGQRDARREPGPNWERRPWRGPPSHAATCCCCPAPTRPRHATTTTTTWGWPRWICRSPASGGRCPQVACGGARCPVRGCCCCRLLDYSSGQCSPVRTSPRMISVGDLVSCRAVPSCAAAPLACGCGSAKATGQQGHTHAEAAAAAPDGQAGRQAPERGTARQERPLGEEMACNANHPFCRGAVRAVRGGEKESNATGQRPAATAAWRSPSDSYRSWWTAEAAIRAGVLDVRAINPVYRLPRVTMRTGEHTPNDWGCVVQCS